MILTPLQQLPSNVSNLGKIIIATGFKCFSKKQKIAQSGHIAGLPILCIIQLVSFNFLARDTFSETNRKLNERTMAL